MTCAVNSFLFLGSLRAGEEAEWSIWCKCCGWEHVKNHWKCKSCHGFKTPFYKCCRTAELWKEYNHQCNDWWWVSFTLHYIICSPVAITECIQINRVCMSNKKHMHCQHMFLCSSRVTLSILESYRACLNKPKLKKALNTVGLRQKRRKKKCVHFYNSMHNIVCIICLLYS